MQSQGREDVMEIKLKQSGHAARLQREISEFA